MLHRKLYQLHCDGHEVNLFLKDQQRWIERAKILDIEGNLVTVRYEIEDEDESSSWEEILLLESIGAVSRQLSFVPRISDLELLVSDDCPAEEQLPADDQSATSESFGESIGDSLSESHPNSAIAPTTDTNYPAADGNGADSGGLSAK